jgi:hypothetical protein
MNIELRNSCLQNFNTIIESAWITHNNTKNENVKLEALELIRNTLMSIVDVCRYHSDSRVDIFPSSLQEEQR